MCGQLVYRHVSGLPHHILPQTLFNFYGNLSTLHIFISHFTVFLEQSRYKQILDLLLSNIFLLL